MQESGLNIGQPKVRDKVSYYLIISLLASLRTGNSEDPVKNESTKKKTRKTKTIPAHY